MLKYIYKASLFFLLISGAYAFDGTISYERFARLSDPQEKIESIDWFGIGLSSKKITHQYLFNVDGDIRYFSEGSAFNFSLSEMYYQRNLGSSRWILGRKTLDWSTHEKFWQLGFLNGQRGFRLLDEKQEGLTGFHFDYRPGELGARFSIFFSYFHIPTLNPSLSISDGVVSSRSEWRKLPPTQTAISGTVVPIYYELNDPSISDIVLQKSLGINLEYSWGQGKVQGYALYKPENGIRANADAFYDIPSEQVKVIANPVVNHHLMTGLSLHQRLGSILFSSGVDFIQPNAKLGSDFDVLTPSQLRSSNKKFESEFFSVEPNYEHETYGYFRASLDRYYYHVSVNYIQLLTSNERVGDDFFSDTVKYKNAFGIDAGFWASERIYLTFDWKYDFSRKDNILRFEGNYRVSSNMSLGLGGELLAAPDDNSYWSAYRTNDTLYGSFNYHF